MDEHRKKILENSLEIIDKLSVLTEYFKNMTLTNIYLQTKVIHLLFDDSEDLDINKLEMFHLQFTETLITLVDQIKQKNERIVRMYEHEIAVNTEMIEKLKTQLHDPEGFDYQKDLQARRMSKSLRDLYTAIYNKNNSFIFTEDISSFYLRFYKDEFFEVERAILNQKILNNRSDVYKIQYATIDKQLLLKLGQNNFKIDFWVGVQFGPVMAEVYQICNTESYFIFIPSRNLFLDIDLTILPHQQWASKINNTEKTVRRLVTNNLKATTNIKNTSQYLSYEIEELLEEDYNKISNIDFLASLEDINIQANVLRTMLETKMI